MGKYRHYRNFARTLNGVNSVNHEFFKNYTYEQLKKYTHKQLSYTYWFVFVYDRTQEDVLRVARLNEKYLNLKITKEERDEWLAGIKGALNASDLQRIEWNTRLIGELELLRLTLSVKEWERPDIPRVSDFTRLLDNVRQIRESGMTLPDTPQVPEHPLNTYQKWNDIERIMYDATCMYVRNVRSFNYCGEISAGEGIGIL